MATACRGGGSSAKAASRGQTIGGKGELPPRILLDKVEDWLGCTARRAAVVLLPLFHVARSCFGLCLLFYGMSIRTFAFHVIVFRVAGYRQVGRRGSGRPGAEDGVREGLLGG